MAAPPPPARLASPLSSAAVPSGSTTSAGSSGGATASSKRKRRLNDLTSEEINEIVALRGKMPQALVGMKFGIEQTEVSAIQRLQRAKTARLLDDHEKKLTGVAKLLQNPVRRVKDVELTVPIAYGTISFWLGKKADEYHSHKWTAYVRSATNEDLSVVIKRVVFQLHHSFSNPTRIVEMAPFELSETGWGEFEISITIFFHAHVAVKPLELFHHLKLYPEDESGPQNTKKPVVVEAYDEIVFMEPSEALFARIRNHPVVMVTGSQASAPELQAGGVNDSVDRKKRETKEHPLAQWFLRHSEADELNLLAAAHQQVRTHITKLKRNLNLLENEAMRLKNNASH